MNKKRKVHQNESENNIHGKRVVFVSQEKFDAYQASKNNPDPNVVFIPILKLSDARIPFNIFGNQNDAPQHTILGALSILNNGGSLNDNAPEDDQATDLVGDL